MSEEKAEYRTVTFFEDFPEKRYQEIRREVLDYFYHSVKRRLAFRWGEGVDVLVKRYRDDFAALATDPTKDRAHDLELELSGAYTTLYDWYKEQGQKIVDEETEKARARLNELVRREAWEAASWHE